jgi:hypothetical protein
MARLRRTAALMMGALSFHAAQYPAPCAGSCFSTDFWRWLRFRQSPLGDYRPSQQQREPAQFNSHTSRQRPERYRSASRTTRMSCLQNLPVSFLNVTVSGAMEIRRHQ